MWDLPVFLFGHFLVNEWTAMFGINIQVDFTFSAWIISLFIEILLVSSLYSYIIYIIFCKLLFFFTFIFLLLLLLLLLVFMWFLEKGLWLDIVGLLEETILHQLHLFNSVLIQLFEFLIVFEILQLQLPSIRILSIFASQFLQFFYIYFLKIINRIEFFTRCFDIIHDILLFHHLVFMLVIVFFPLSFQMSQLLLLLILGLNIFKALH